VKKNIFYITVLIMLLIIILALSSAVWILYTREGRILDHEFAVIKESSAPASNSGEKVSKLLYEKYTRYGIKPREAMYYE